MNTTRRTLTALAALALATTLAACGGSADKAESADTAAPPAAETTDLTDALKADLESKFDKATADQVTKATETEPGRVEVETTIKDDGTREGDALAICKAATALLNVDEPKGSVFESDGTTYVVSNHPTYGEGCHVVD